MKKAKYLSLLAAALLLVGCGTTTSSSNEPTPSSPSSEEPSSVAPALTQAEVDEKLGDSNKLKELLVSYVEKGVSSLQVSSETPYEVTTTSVTLKTREMLIDSVCVKNNGNEKTSTSYTGLFSDTKYYLSLDGEYGSINTEQLYASAEDIPEGEWGAMTVAQAEEEFASTVSYQVDLSQSLWSGLFEENYSEDENYNNGTLIDSYSALLSEDGKSVSVRAKAHQNEYDKENLDAKYFYSYVAEFDENFVITSGTLTIDYYDADQLDENGEPLENAEKKIYGSSVESLLSYSVGNVEESGSSPMIDLEPYYVSSLTEDAYCCTKLEGNASTGWKPIFSNKNEVYAGSSVTFIGSEWDDETESYANYFLPKTALDGDSLRIVSSSNTDVVDLEFVPYWPGEPEGDYVWYANPDAVGQTATLTIGSDSNDNVGQVTVTVTENPNKAPLPELNFDADVLFVDDSAGSFDPDNGITLNSLKPTYFGLPTYNSGPFDLSSYEVVVSDPTVVSLELDNEFGSQSGNLNALFVYASPLKEGTTMFSIKDTKKQEVVYSTSVTVEKPAPTSVNLTIVDNTGLDVYCFVSDSASWQDGYKYPKFSGAELVLGEQYYVSHDMIFGTEGKKLLVEVTLNGVSLGRWVTDEEFGNVKSSGEDVYRFTPEEYGELVVTLTLGDFNS